MYNALCSDSNEKLHPNQYYEQHEKPFSLTSYFCWLYILYMKMQLISQLQWSIFLFFEYAASIHIDAYERKNTHMRLHIHIALTLKFPCQFIQLNILDIVKYWEFHIQILIHIIVDTIYTNDDHQNFSMFEFKKMHKPWSGLQLNERWKKNVSLENKK